MLVTGQIVAALTDGITELRGQFVEGALETPRADITPYQIGVIVGNIQGFKRALAVIHEIIAKEAQAEAR